MAKAKGLSKAQCYLSRIFTIEYDLDGAIKAYGPDFLHWLIDEIAAGRVNCKQDVDRWSAHLALQDDANWAIYKSEHNISDYEPDDFDAIEEAA
jgi:hypothetical protein